MANGNGRWGTGAVSVRVLNKMFQRPIETKALTMKLGHPENVQRFRKNNRDLLIYEPTPQLNYIKGWFLAIPIGERLPVDYVMSRRLQLQEYEEVMRRKPRTQTTMTAIVKALRTLAEKYIELADELEAHLAETYEQENIDGTDGSVHSSESD